MTLARGRVAGAFRPIRQRPGELLKFEWACADDDADRPGTFTLRGSGEAHVDAGGYAHVRFGEFQFEWSIALAGLGRALYSDDGETAFCVTDRTAIDGLDPFASNLVYSQFAGDPGRVFVANGEPKPVVRRLRLLSGEVPSSRPTEDARTDALVWIEEVADKEVLLLSLGTARGLLVFDLQNASTRTANFQWRYRRDGLGTLRAGDEGVCTGEGTASESLRTCRIQFGPFDVEWQPGSRGRGFVRPGLVVQNPGVAPVLLCSAGVVPADEADATAPTLVYRTGASGAQFRFE